MENIEKKLEKNILSYPIVMHLIYWMLFILSDTVAYLRYDKNPFIDEFKDIFIYYLFFTIPAYLHYDWIIPRFFKKGKFLTYIFLTLACILFFAYSYLMFKGTYGRFSWAILHAFLSEIITLTTFTTWRLFVENIQEKERQAKSEKLHTQNQLSLLKGQINPHFLFNTMNSFYALSVTKSDKLPDLLLQHSDLLRYTLYETNNALVPLEQEIQFISNYIDLEKIRLEADVAIDFEISGILQDQQIAPLLFIPFVENAFKHCRTNQAQKSYIDIHFYLAADSIHLSVKNTCDGCEVMNGKAKGGIGLENVKKRLSLLYPEQYKLEFTSKENDYFQVDLWVAVGAN